MSILFTYPLLIKEHHLDTFGHVNNATYLAIFEEARWEFVTDNGYGLNKMIETGLAPTILEVKLRFLKEVRLRDEVIIQTQIPPYKGKIGMIHQAMMRGAEVCCSAEFTMAFFNLKERKIVSPTQEWLAALGL